MPEITIKYDNPKTLKLLKALSSYFDFVITNPNSVKKGTIAPAKELKNKQSKTKKEKFTSLQSLFGAYQSDETAEEIINEIRTSRTFNRKVESL